MAGRFIRYPQPAWRRTEINSDGFTLLEIICALALLGLVALAAFTFLGQSLSFWERSGRWGENEQAIRLTKRLFDRFLGRLYTGRLPLGEKQGFIGDETTLSALLEGETGLDAARFRYDVSNGTLSYWEETNGERKESILVEGIDQLHFAYMDKDQNWQPAWEEQQPLPRYIRIQWSYRHHSQPTIMLPVFGSRVIAAP